MTNLSSIKTRTAAAPASILLVAEGATLRKFYTGFCAHRGYSVSVADSGEAALELWKHLDPKPQLLLADLCLPAKSAKELADSLRRIQPGIRVRFIAENGFELIDEEHGGFHDTYMTFVPLVLENLAHSIHVAIDDQRAC